MVRCFQKTSATKTAAYQFSELKNGKETSNIINLQATNGLEKTIT